MNNNYDSFEVDDFLDDKYFIEWIKNPNPDSDEFWMNWSNNKPANLTAMRQAELQLKALLSAGSFNLPHGEAHEVWDKIEKSIDQPKDIPFPGASRRIIRSWWAAAAIIFIMGAGIYFFLDRPHVSKTQIAGNKTTLDNNDIAPGGNKAMLTLANGSTIILDSVPNGTLPQQGNTKVIKLDGQIVYNKSNEKPGEIIYNTITTPRGGQYQLVLADGSRVWLNAASSLRFPTSFTGSDRKVELTGEGYFEVAHDASHPFHVLVSPPSGAVNEVTDVRVLGTHFNVNAYDDENNLRATLLEGAVKVSRGAENVLISPNEQAVLKNVGGKININKDVDVEVVIAWKNGLFQFNQADVETVMRKIARWYDIEVEFQGKIPETLFAGKISRNSNVSTVLKVLAEGGIHFKIESKKIIVSP